MDTFSARRLSDVKDGHIRYSFRKWLAITLLSIAVLLSAWLLSQDVDWEYRSIEARNNGMAANAAGNYQVARKYLDQAVAINPYDWESHLWLGRLLSIRFTDYQTAVRHFLLALAYGPETGIAAGVDSELAIAKLVADGELENPLYAIEDMFTAVEEGAYHRFTDRLAPELSPDALEFWNEWLERGRGTINLCRIKTGNDGLYDANVEIFFPQGVAMSMHFACVKGGVWYLDISFP